MTIANRKDVREAWATVLTSVMDTAQEVEVGQPASLDGRTPIVIVSSAGSGRAGSEGPKFSTFAGSIPVFFLDQYHFVLATTGVDDTLDTLEYQTALAVQNNQVHARWTAVSYRERSKPQFLETTDGKQYKFEVIYLSFTGRS